MKRLALLGASGHGKVVADAALACGWEQVEFFDDAWPSRRANGLWSVAGTSSNLLAHAREFDGVLVSIGNCEIRWRKQLELRAAGATLATIVHPRAFVSRHAVLGEGCVVMAGAVVNIDANVGQACIINTGATVDHDCHIADAVHLAPGAHLSGSVEIGALAWVGTGAAVRQGLRIGERAMVGVGAVVVRSVLDGQTVAGNPARPLQCFSRN